MSIFHKWKSRLIAKTVPAIIVHDAFNIEVHDGLVKGTNTLFDPWQEKGYEIHADPIHIIRGGKTVSGYLCSSYGMTAELKEDIHVHPTGLTSDIFIRWDGSIGAMLQADVIAKATELAASMRDKLIFLGVGLLLGWTVLSPIMGQILS